MQYHLKEIMMSYPLTFSQYQKGLENGKFLGLTCDECGAYTFPPRGVCSKCGSQRTQVTEIQGKGTIRTFTIIRVAPEGMNPPYIVAIVELDQGPWVMGNVVGLNPDDLDMDLIGSKVIMASQPVKGDLFAREDIRVLTFHVA
jgi:uncharacterized OB-fold protein